MMLIGMITFIFSVFYGTNYPDVDVQHATWSTMCEAISLFCAVLFFATFKDICVLQFGETGGHHNSVPDTTSLILSFVRLLIAFWGVQALLLRYRWKELSLKAWSSIGGNFIAFAAIDSMGMVQQISPFADNPANAFLGTAIAAVLVASMCISGYITRNYWMENEDGTMKEHDIKWAAQCEEMENQFSSICVGLLLSIVIRYSISGSLPAIWGSPRNKTQSQVYQLAGVSLGLAVPVFGLSIACDSLEKHSGSIPMIARATRVLQLTFAMSMGWSMCFCGEWEFYSSTHGKGVGIGDKMTMRMMNALVVSYICFFFIISLDFIADRIGMARKAFDAVTRAFVLSLGVAWQGAFKEAVGGISDRYEDDTTRTYMDALMTVSLCASVLPAWFWFMLPKALAGPQPLEGTKELWLGDADGAVGEDGRRLHADDMAPQEEAFVDPSEPKECCLTCGTEFEEDAQFCQNCGGRRPGAAATPMSAAPLPTPPPPLPGKGFASAGASFSGASGGGKASDGKGGGRGNLLASMRDAVEPEDNWAGDATF
jgi:hypothetical protein